MLLNDICSLFVSCVICLGDLNLILSNTCETESVNEKKDQTELEIKALQEKSNKTLDVLKRRKGMSHKLQQTFTINKSRFFICLY